LGLTERTSRRSLSVCVAGREASRARHLQALERTGPLKGLVAVARLAMVHARENPHQKLLSWQAMNTWTGRARNKRTKAEGV